MALLSTVVPAGTAQAGLVGGGPVGDDSCIVYYASTGQQVFFCDADIRPTGTGNFDPFLRVGRDGTHANPSDDTEATYSSGWNTDATHQSGVDGLNDFDASWTSSLPLSDITMTNAPPTGSWDAAVAGSSYALFTVDINQMASLGGDLLSLNQMILYDCSTTGYTSLSQCNGSFFDLFGVSGDFVNFDYRNHQGSGNGDVDVYIQNAGVDANGTPVPTFGGPYIALLDGWGCGSGSSIDPPYPCSLAGIEADNDGFQEWATTGAGNPPGTIPEPASLLLLGSGLSAIGVAARRRNRTQKKS